MELVQPTDAPEDTQPIPAEKFKEFYVAELELRVQGLALEKQEADLRARLKATQDAFTKMFTDLGLNKDEWDFNLKTGEMKKKA